MSVFQMIFESYIRKTIKEKGILNNNKNKIKIQAFCLVVTSRSTVFLLCECNNQATSQDFYVEVSRLV